jgi:acyl-CoA reductase-like NAD-dependent aldehyde dehydrogenase
LVSVLAPVMVTGCTAVVIASEARPLPAVTLAEVLATSDVPAGVVNVLTGHTMEVAPVLAAHMDVNAIDLVGAPAEGVAELQRAAAGNVKRAYGHGAHGAHGGPSDAASEWSRDPGLERIRAVVEIKTVWHPMGL